MKKEMIGRPILNGTAYGNPERASSAWPMKDSSARESCLSGDPYHSLWMRAGENGPFMGPKLFKERTSGRMQVGTV